MRILVTAGPTREHLDRVRFLSNGATGRLGIEIARAAAEAGHGAVLVLGPTHLDPPDHPAVETVPVVSALEMLAACRTAWPRCDAVIATAAVCDHRPAVHHPGKPEKSDSPAALELVRNPDIVATLAAEKGSRTAVGFALQVDDAELRARAKLVAKHLDAIVIDSPAALGADRADFRLMTPDGNVRLFNGVTKRELAQALVAFVTGHCGA